MAQSVAQIREQIAKLQAREQEALAREADGVVARIKEAIAFYKLTPERLFGDEPAPSIAQSKAEKPKASGVAKPVTEKGPAKAARKSLKGSKVAAKYRDDQGNSWSGRGSQPRWLKAAIEGGKTLESFSV